MISRSVVREADDHIIVIIFTSNMERKTMKLHGKGREREGGESEERERGGREREGGR